MKKLTRFAMRLKKCRIERKITQAQLAQHLGLTLRHYQRIEHCEVNTSAIVLLELSNYFNISIDYLLGRTDDPKLHQLRSKEC